MHRHQLSFAAQAHVRQKRVMPEGEVDAAWPTLVQVHPDSRCSDVCVCVCLCKPTLDGSRCVMADVWQV